MEKKALNEASLNVWYEYNKDNKNLELSEKILLISGSHDLSEKEIIELNELIELEYTLLQKAKEEIVKNNQISKKINDFLHELNDDERLITLFSNMAISRYLDGDYKDENDVEQSYHELRQKDVDVEGHEELNKIYSDMISAIDNLGTIFNDDKSENSCNVENCIYCTPPNEEEKQNAYDSLVGDGYFNMGSKEALIELMVIIHRYERLNKGFFDDIDNDSEE